MPLSQLQSLQLKPKLCLAQTNSLEILSFNNVELKDYLMAEQMENPLLEIHENYADDELLAVGLWFSQQEISPPYQKYEEIERCFDLPDLGESRLRGYLKDQIRPHELTGEEYRLLCKIIDLLDADTGFLTIPLKEIACLSGASCETVAKCLRHLQSLEPAGVGAANVRQCLILQAKRSGCASGALTDLILNHLEDVAAKNYKKIARALHLSRRETMELIRLIQSFNPRPSRGFSDCSAPYVVPDVLVGGCEGEWEVALNDRWIGRVDISRFYKNYMEQANDEKVRQYLQAKISRAKFVLQCVEQRRQTLLKVSRLILEKQKNFIAGSGPLRAMSLTDLAVELGLHPSTVSRAVKGKYLQTPRGLFPFKHFFTGKISLYPQREEETVGSAEVKAILSALIGGEDKKSPLSDLALTRELTKKGVIISRRTVAKYRQSLNFPGAAKRRKPDTPQ